MPTQNAELKLLVLCRYATISTETKKRGRGKKREEKEAENIKRV